MQHRSQHQPNLLAYVLGRSTQLPVKMAQPGETPRPGTVYLAPADRQMRLDRHLCVRFSDGLKIRHVLSSANPLFDSAAQALKGADGSLPRQPGPIQATPERVECSRQIISPRSRSIACYQRRRFPPTGRASGVEEMY